MISNYLDRTLEVLRASDNPKDRFGRVATPERISIRARVENVTALNSERGLDYQYKVLTDTDVDIKTGDSVIIGEDEVQVKSVNPFIGFGTVAIELLL